MRPVREITPEEENFRTEPIACGANWRAIGSRRDPVEPEAIGTIVLRAFRIAGYDQDCDGSLMARLESIDRDGGRTGWTPDCIGIYPSSSVVVTLEEWAEMFRVEERDGTADEREA